MRKNFDDFLGKLNVNLLEMASLVQQIIAMSIKSLEEQDKKLAQETIEFDLKINDLERRIESICLKLLLQYQPVVAHDLKKVSSALKMITDMERIGDQSADIAQLNITLIEKNQTWDLGNISKMAKSATVMVSEAIEAYINNDIARAEAVIKSDDEIDELFEKTKSDIIEEIAQNKALGLKSIDTLMVAKYFERIGDHAVNIAEWVVFSITGVHKSERIM